MSDSADFIKAVAELIRAAAWPISATIIAKLFAPYAAKFLGSLSDRDLELKAPGFEAKLSGAKQQEGSNPASGGLVDFSKERTSAALETTPSEAILLMENTLRSSLEAFPEAEQIPLLIRRLAESRLRAGHEFIYNRIFGSQIMALKRLNTVPSATIENAKEFFEPIRAQYPEVYEKYGFDGWFGFLLTNLLINQDGNEIKISPYGRDFLVYVTVTRLNETKLY